MKKAFFLFYFIPQIFGMGCIQWELTEKMAEGNIKHTKEAKKDLSTCNPNVFFPKMHGESAYNYFKSPKDSVTQYYATQYCNKYCPTDFISCSSELYSQAMSACPNTCMISFRCIGQTLLQAISSYALVVKSFQRSKRAFYHCHNNCIAPSFETVFSTLSTQLVDKKIQDSAKTYCKGKSKCISKMVHWAENNAPFLKKQTKKITPHLHKIFKDAKNKITEAYTLGHSTDGTTSHQILTSLSNKGKEYQSIIALFDKQFKKCIPGCDNQKGTFIANFEIFNTGVETFYTSISKILPVLDSEAKKNIKLDAPIKKSKNFFGSPVHNSISNIDTITKQISALIKDFAGSNPSSTSMKHYAAQKDTSSMGPIGKILTNLAKNCSSCMIGASTEIANQELVTASGLLFSIGLMALGPIGMAIGIADMVTNIVCSAKHIKSVYCNLPGEGMQITLQAIGDALDFLQEWPIIGPIVTGLKDLLGPVGKELGKVLGFVAKGLMIDFKGIENWIKRLKSCSGGAVGLSLACGHHGEEICDCHLDDPIPCKGVCKCT